MAEYIDKELAIEGMWAGLREGTICGPEDTETFLRSLPAADVEPVRHGRWVPIQHYDSHDIFECSECGRGVVHVPCDYTVQDDYPYCHCGAKMDGEVTKDG